MMRGRQEAKAAEAVALRELVVRAGAETPLAITLAEVREVTGIGHVGPADAIHHLARAADQSGALSRAAFVHALGRAAKEAGADLGTPLQAKRFGILASRIFDAFAGGSAGPGLASFDDAAVGISFLSRGDAEERASCAFQVIDADGNGELDLGELTSMFEAVLRLAYQLEPSVRDVAKGLSPQRLAQASALAALRDAGGPNARAMSYEQFRDFWSAGTDGGLGAASPPLTVASGMPPG